MPPQGSIQSLFFDDLTGNSLGHRELVHILPSGETFTCSSTAEDDWTVFDLPVIEAVFDHLPPPFCDGELMTFRDDGIVIGDVSYDYWTSGGLDEMMVSDNEIQFTLFSEETTFEVTKYETHVAPDDPMDSLTCSVILDTTFAVVANPVLAINGNPGICQGEGGMVVLEVTNLSCLHLFTNLDGI